MRSRVWHGPRIVEECWTRILGQKRGPRAV